MSRSLLSVTPDLIHILYNIIYKYKSITILRFQSLFKFIKRIMEKKIRHSSAKKDKKLDSQQSTSQSSNSKHYQDKFPDIFKKNKRHNKSHNFKVANKSVRQFIKQVKQQDDLSPRQHVKHSDQENTHKRFPRIKIVNDCSEFNSKKNDYKKRERCKSQEHDRLEQVEQTKDQQQHQKEKFKTHKFVTDLNQFNNITKSSINFSTPSSQDSIVQSNNYDFTDIQEVVEQDQPKKRDSERQMFKLLVDQLDQPRKKYVKQMDVQEIEQQKQKMDDDQSLMVLRKNFSEEKQFLKKIMKSEMVDNSDYCGYENKVLQQIQEIRQQNQQVTKVVQ